MAIEYQQTSRDAWQWFSQFSCGLDRQIIEALDNAGRDGLICQEIEQQLQRSHQSVSGNLRHLVERGVVCKTKFRAKTTSGRKAIKWVTRWNYDEKVHSDVCLRKFGFMRQA